MENKECTTRKIVEIEKYYRKWKEKAIREQQEPTPVEIKIELKWVKSRTWGKNPNGMAKVTYENCKTKSYWFSCRCRGSEHDKRTECVVSLLNQCTRGLMWRSKSTIGFQRQKDKFVSWERSGLERIFEQFKDWGYKVEYSDLEMYDLIYIYKNIKNK